MYKKRKRFLKLKFNIFVVFLCVITALLGYGFDKLHADGIHLAENVVAVKTEEKKYIQMVQLNRNETSTSTGTSSFASDTGATAADDADYLIPVYSQPDTASEKLEDVFTGEWASYVGETSGFIQVKTAKGTTGYVSSTQCQVTKVEEKEKPKSLEGTVIVLDPGHGGEDVGAESTNKEYFEKDLTLSTAKAVKKKLEAAGATVYLTRSKDDSVSLTDRTKVAMSKAADVFISLHYDSFDTSNTMSGFTTYYYYSS